MKDIFAGHALGGATSERIAAFEEFIHAKLPSDYHRFLELYNGGLPDAATCSFFSPVELPGGSNIEVQEFFALRQSRSFVGCLQQVLEKNIGWLGHTSIPVAADNFGNLVCLDCETGLMEWLLLEPRFKLDFARIFMLGTDFTTFIEELAPRSSLSS